MAPRPPDELILFLDENLDSDVVCAALAGAEIRFERYRSHFAAGIDDTAWIPVIAERGWAIVTRDGRIRRRPLEREAMLEAGAIVVMIRGQALGAAALAAALLAGHARLVSMARSRRPPMVLFLHPDGRPELKEGGDRRGGRRK